MALRECNKLVVHDKKVKQCCPGHSSIIESNVDLAVQALINSALNKDLSLQLGGSGSKQRALPILGVLAKQVTPTT